MPRLLKECPPDFKRYNVVTKQCKSKICKRSNKSRLSNGKCPAVPKSTKRSGTTRKSRAKTANGPTEEEIYDFYDKFYSN